MGYTKFSTDRADYHLEYGLHYRNTDLKDIEKIDAVVLEASGKSKNELEFVKKPHRHYKNIIKKAERSEIPLYIADADLGISYIIPSSIIRTALITIPCYLSAFSSSIANYEVPLAISAGAAASYFLPSITSALSAFYLAFKKDEIKDSKAEKIISKASYLPPSPIILGRNIITTEKVEEFIAPKLKDEIGRKPNIGIIYGALHAGIKSNLENTAQRKRLLKLYSKINYFGIRKDTMGDILEFRYNEKDWNVEEFNTGLF